ncbi:MAG: GNAT family N-acetyltransferase [Bacteroidetes bacterium]|nr:GNAT family N-acetyltransferase [Bacteroidota bacterium]
MELLPVKATLEENPEFVNHPDCQESLQMSIDFYKSVGFDPPWIGYYASQEGRLVGCAAFKGRPVGGSVEIAYGTFERFRQQGIGTEMCRQLVLLSLQTDASVRITARTLPENNFSTRILEKNGFRLLGMVFDKDDGDVWEWEYRP